MYTFVLRRLLAALPLLLAVTLVGFALIHLAPGGPLAVYANNPNVNAEELERMKAILGLDRPLYIQYLAWLRGLVAGNWGFSYVSGRPVLTVIGERIPATLLLMVSSFLVSVGVAVPAGVIAATRRGTAVDHSLSAAAIMGVSIPTFWFGLMVIWFFAGRLNWIPSGGMAALGAAFSLGDRLRHLIAPTLVLGLVSTAAWSRYMRSSMLDALGQDYLRTAKAKGLSQRTVIWKHALRNAMLPIVTLMGLQVPNFFGGAVVTETLFSWPGLGRLYYDSINQRDYPVLLAALVISAGLVLIGNLLADLMYGVVNPRIRYQ